MVILTDKEIYFYKRKGIKFWLKILILKIKKTKYEIINDKEW